MENYVFGILWFIVPIAYSILLTSLWIYGAMFAKREWLRTLCMIVILLSCIGVYYRLVEAFKEYNNIVYFIIGFIISVIIFYTAYHLALFYKKDKKSNFIKNSYHSKTYPIYSKENLKIDFLPSAKNDIDSKDNYQVEFLNKEVVLETKMEHENIESKNDRIFCPFCGKKNIANANFCYSCGKDMRLDTKNFRDYNVKFIESKKEDYTTRVSILKYGGLFQILIGLHGLFLIVGSLMVIFEKNNPLFDTLILLLILALFVYIFYQYFRYKKSWTYYVFLVCFGLLCIFSFFVMFSNPFCLIVFILYCLILWYLYESLKLNH